MRKIIYVLAIAGLLVSCGSNETKKESSETSYEEALARMNQSYHTIVIDEVVDGGNYSYIRYSQDGKEYWGAINARPLEVGKTYYYRDALEMKNFQSKTLDKVFPSIWFINDFSEEPPQNRAMGSMETMGGKKAHKSDNLAEDHHKATDVHEQIEVEKAEGGYSLAEIFEKKSDLEATEVLVKGQVVKINTAIMNTNWVHIQDGTSYNGVFDLTVTTDEDIQFQIGDVVTFKGKLALNKDFGYGYKYDYIVEKAKIQ
jgi:hypothetical protein